MAAVKLELIRPSSGTERATVADQAGAETDPLADLARQSLYYMAMMREVEDRIERKLYRQGKVVGGVYVGRGQEAIPVGSGLAVRPDDMLFPSHRDMALFLIRGVSARQIFAQYMGRVDGLTNGRDGNMHMGDLSKRLVAIISAMAASIPVAAGAAMGMKYQGKDTVTVVYFGDGATSRGDWHEGINLASVQKAPLVLICNNNQYAYSTPLSKQMACANVADRAPGYGIPSEVVDGNDVLAIHEASRRAIAHARAGHGPFLIECKTFRMTGHSAHDPADYVPKHLFAEWSAQCPIARLEKKIIERGWASVEEVASIRARVVRESDEAVEAAEKSPYPDASTLLDNLYEK
ncbi:MAG: thiamine pyrophosphate-dependent dehydrogenase E1 component subunit alpha [Acidobacteria bacterium]|nr:thiamine pyrophosphate-dependent dehydrogenase E1 component subunit alpha [Acidobacteriota bacterium]